MVAEELDPAFIPAAVELYVDGAFFSTFKMLELSFAIDIRAWSNGRHDLWLKLTDEAGSVLNGRTSFMVQNASVDVVSAESPNYAFPGETLELWLEVTGSVNRIEPDFSAIDAGFDQSQV